MARKKQESPSKKTKENAIFAPLYQDFLKALPENDIWVLLLKKVSTLKDLTPIERLENLALYIRENNLVPNANKLNNEILIETALDLGTLHIKTHYSSTPNLWKRISEALKKILFFCLPFLKAKELSMPLDSLESLDIPAPAYTPYTEAPTVSPVPKEPLPPAYEKEILFLKRGMPFLYKRDIPPSYLESQGPIVPCGQDAPPSYETSFSHCSVSGIPKK